MGVSLYRKYRPQKFSDVVGQAAAIGLLTRSLELSRISHAYLFSGSRGCGKTTAARLLAKAANCLDPLPGAEPCCKCSNCLAITAGESLDVIEIDGASNNTVDEVRELKTHVALVPFSSKYKIYIIDEVHMLSTSAFNALLKTLEEPPSHVIFILATTEPHKVPVTIRSRCQHVPFHSIGAKLIFERLNYVCDAEGAKAQPEALWEIARQADGALRDALSILEQTLSRSGGELSLADVEAVLGEGSRPALERWIAGWQNPGSETFNDLNRMLVGSTSPHRFLEELFSLIRNMWLAVQWKETIEFMDVSDQEKVFLREQSGLWDAKFLQRMMSFIAGILPQSRGTFRSDVLCGLLMLEISRLNEPEASQEPVQPAAPSGHAATFHVQQSQQPQQGGTFSQAKKQPEPDDRKDPPQKRQSVKRQTPPLPQDESEPAPAIELPGECTPCPDENREELLNILKENNFMIYCGLLEATPFQAGSALLWDFPHDCRYPYETLSLPRNRSAISSLFPEYEGGVFLRFGERTASCTAPDKEGRGKGMTSDNPEDALPESTAGNEPPPAGTSLKDSTGALPFSGLLREVSRIMNGEVLLVRRSADIDADSDSEETLAASESNLE